MIKHKQGKSNVVVDALSRIHTLLSLLEINFLSFDHVKELYPKDVDFSIFIVSAIIGDIRTTTYTMPTFSKVRDFVHTKDP